MAYVLETLASDWAAVAAEFQPTGNTVPVLYGGWSMGAEQAVPAAAAATPPVRGLLLLSPGRRGRYGLETTDGMGIPPTGKGTFALADFAAQLAGMRVVQLHGKGDMLDSTTWQEGLWAPHRLFIVPNGWHNFSSAGDALPKTLNDALEWLLQKQDDEN